MAAPAAGGTAAAGDGLTDPNVIIKRFQMLQGECQQLVAKVRQDRLKRRTDFDRSRDRCGWDLPTAHPRPTPSKQLQELEIDLAEHQLVANQLKPLDGGRKAFRLVGGVLMERTVGDVLPELTSTAEMVRGSMDGGLRVKSRRSLGSTH